MIKNYDLFEEANKRLEEARKNNDALMLVIELLKENLEFTMQENRELAEENAAYRKQLYNDASERMFDFE